jgi:hypothetical protein
MLQHLNGEGQRNRRNGTAGRERKEPGTITSSDFSLARALSLSFLCSTWPNAMPGRSIPCLFFFFGPVHALQHPSRNDQSCNSFAWHRSAFSVSPSLAPEFTLSSLFDLPPFGDLWDADSLCFMVWYEYKLTACLFDLLSSGLVSNILGCQVIDTYMTEH